MRSPRVFFACSLALVLFVPRSLNAGVNDWTNISPPAGDVEQIAFDPVNPQNVYAILSGQLYASRDGAQDWHPVESLSVPQRIRTIAIDPHQSGTIYAAPLERGITKSTDYGATWQFLGLAAESVIFITVHPVKPWMLYAVTGNDLYRSTDRGASWKAVSGRGQAGMLAFSPANPSVIYAGGFLKSTDEGATWHRIGSGFRNVAIHLESPGTLIGWDDWNIGRSTDGGCRRCRGSRQGTQGTEGTQATEARDALGPFCPFCPWCPSFADLCGLPLTPCVSFPQGEGS